MKNILFLIPFLFFASCVHKTPVVPKPPIASESAVSDSQNTQNGINSGISENSKIKDRIKKQQEIIDSQKNELEVAIARSKIIEEKAKADAKITSEESTLLVNQLYKVKDQNNLIKEENSNLTTINENQSKILEKAKLDAVETHRKLILKENETNELRMQNKYLATNLQQNQDEILKLNKDLASAAVYKRWVIGIIITIIILSIGYLFLKFGINFIKPI